MLWGSRAVSFGVCQGVSLGVRQGVSLRLRLARRLVGGGGGCFALALANMVQVFLGNLGGGEGEAMGQLAKLGFVWVFHLDDPRFPPVDTSDGAHLHTRGVWDVDFGAEEGVVGTAPAFFWGGVVLGAGVAYVAGGGLGGGRFLLGGGGVAPYDESSDSKCHLELFVSPGLVTRGSGGGGLAWGGGGGLLFHRFLTLPITPTSLPISPRPPPPCTPSALTWPTPRLFISLHPPTPVNNGSSLAQPSWRACADHGTSAAVRAAAEVGPGAFRSHSGRVSLVGGFRGGWPPPRPPPPPPTPQPPPRLPPPPHFPSP